MAFEHMLRTRKNNRVNEGKDYKDSVEDEYIVIYALFEGIDKMLYEHVEFVPNANH
jgi:hypothetical protein